MGCHPKLGLDLLAEKKVSWFMLKLFYNHVYGSELLNKVVPSTKVMILFAFSYDTKNKPNSSRIIFS